LYNTKEYIHEGPECLTQMIFTILTISIIVEWKTWRFKLLNSKVNDN